MKNTMDVSKSSKKLLIIGANGFLGTYLIQVHNKKDYEGKKFHLIASDIENTNIEKNVPFYKIDITERDDTLKKIVKISPDVVLLTAAMTDVDQNEVDKELATKINTEGPKNVLKACKKISAKLVFISTDFVFDGEKQRDFYYQEEDTPNPLSHYAKTKYNAELALINSDINYLICRTAVLYGWNLKRLNFITWILDKLQQQEKISIVKTQINNATFVKNLAEILLKLIEKDAKGIYHTAGDGALNRYEMALKCAEIFNYNKDLIIPIENLEQKAIRPKNAGLDISKLKELIGSELKIFSLEDGLNYMKNHRVA